LPPCLLRSLSPAGVIFPANFSRFTKLDIQTKPKPKYKPVQ